MDDYPIPKIPKKFSKRSAQDDNTAAGSGEEKETNKGKENEKGKEKEKRAVYQVWDIGQFEGGKLSYISTDIQIDVRFSVKGNPPSPSWWRCALEVHLLGRKIWGGEGRGN